MDIDDDEFVNFMRVMVELGAELKSLPMLKDLMPSDAELLALSKGVNVDEVLDLLAGILQDDVADADSIGIPKGGDEALYKKQLCSQTLDLRDESHRMKRRKHKHR